MTYLKPEKNLMYKVADIGLADWGVRRLNSPRMKCPVLWLYKKNTALGNL